MTPFRRNGDWLVNIFTSGTNWIEQIPKNPFSLEAHLLKKYMYFEGFIGYQQKVYICSSGRLKGFHNL